MVNAPCARCGTEIQCWPYRVGVAVCAVCLRLIKSENGRRRKGPPVGTQRIRCFRGKCYVMQYNPGHPDAPAAGWMMVHRIIMESLIGRRLTPEEVVHHRDGNGLNNDASNLELEENKGSHLALHHSAAGVAARMAGYPRCQDCGERTMRGADRCWACWKKSQTCPACGRAGRKMATREYCHGCYKAHRLKSSPA